MSGWDRPLFRKRPPSRGYGHDPVGPAGWAVTIGFSVLAVATGIPADVLLRRPDWPLGALLLLIGRIQAITFVAFAARESRRG